MESADSISMSATTLSYNSLETLQSEYIDDEDTWSMKSVGGTDINKLLIYEEAHTPGLLLLI